MPILIRDVFIQERARLHKQIITITDEFEKELKYREGALHLIDIYSSSEPISMASSGPTGNASVGKPTKLKHHSKHGSSGKPVPRDVDAERAHAIQASTDALLSTTHQITNLSITLQSLHDRHAYLTAQLSGHLIVTWLQGMQAMWERMQDREMERLRQQQVHGEQQQHHHHRGHDSRAWRDVARLLCQELVRVGGEKYWERHADSMEEELDHHQQQQQQQRMNGSLC